MEDKLILSIGGILFSGAVLLTSINNPCIKDGEVLLSPELTIESGVEKACFELEEDYQVFKDEVLRKYLHAGQPIEGTLDSVGSPSYNDYLNFILVFSEELKRENINSLEVIRGNRKDELLDIIQEEGITYVKRFK